MRDTKDIAEAVFRIRDEHLARQRRKRIRAEKACAAVSAIAAAVVITAGMTIGELSHPKPRG